MRSVPGHTKYVAMSVLLGLFSISAFAEDIDAAATPSSMTTSAGLPA
ncbi:hypothetical protein [Denitromonas ohlonensis]|nr:hypothetical protein [Denitromonas ohlonensis]